MFLVIFNSLPIELVGQLLAPSVVLNYSSLLKNTLSNEIEPVGELRPTIIAVQCLPKNMEKTKFVFAARVKLTVRRFALQGMRNDYLKLCSHVERPRSHNFCALLATTR